MCENSKEVACCHKASYPTISVGSTEFPAPLLPVCIALAYAVWFLSGRPTVPQRRQNKPVAEKNGWHKSSLVQDEENLAIKETPRTKPTFRDFVFNLIHWYYTMTSLVTGGRSLNRPLAEICLVQVAFVVGTSLIYDHWLSTDDVALAGGWLLLFVQHLFASPRPMLNDGIAVAILVAVVVYMVSRPQLKTNKRELESSTSASLLLVLATKPYLNTVSWPAAIISLETYAVSPWVFVPLCIILSGRDVARSWKTISVLNPNLPAMDRFRILARDKRISSSGVISFILGPISFVAVFFGAIIPISFLSSCLPFRRLLLGLPCEAPATGGMGLLVGVFIYMPMSVIWMSRTMGDELSQKERNSYGLKICAESVALTVVVLVAIAGALEAFRLF